MKKGRKERKIDRSREGRDERRSSRGENTGDDVATKRIQ